MIELVLPHKWASKWAAWDSLELAQGVSQPPLENLPCTKAQHAVVLLNMETLSKKNLLKTKPEN